MGKGVNVTKKWGVGPDFATDYEKQFMKNFRDEFVNTVNADDDGVLYIRDIRVKLVSCALERERLIEQLAGQFYVDQIDAFFETNYGIKM